MQVQRFNFRDFGEGAPASRAQSLSKTKADAPPPPPPPTFSEEELKAAEREGYKKGFLAGEQEGRKKAQDDQAEIHRKLAETVEYFIQSVTPLFNEHRRMNLELQQHMPKIAFAIARKVAGEALAQNAQAVISEVATRACETMLKEPKLSITVHESLADALAKQLESLTSRLQSATDIVVLRNPDLPIADCRIAWNHGSIERNTDQLWKQVEQAVGNIAATNVRNAEDQLKTLSPLSLPPQAGGVINNTSPAYGGGKVGELPKENLSSEKE